jgi:serine/threonine-protein kinase
MNRPQPNLADQPDNTPRERRLDEALTCWFDLVDEGQAPAAEAFLERYPDLRPELSQFFAKQVQVDQLTRPLRSVLASATPCSPEANLESPRKPLKLGDYELGEVIGYGGMGVVYKAVQRSLNRAVAVKTIRAGRFATETEVRRFRREAELAATLDHPAIVPVYEVGEEEGEIYFSMKLIDGPNLAEAVASGRRPGAGSDVNRRTARLGTFQERTLRV